MAGGRAHLHVGDPRQAAQHAVAQVGLHGAAHALGVRAGAHEGFAAADQVRFRLPLSLLLLLLLHVLMGRFTAGMVPVAAARPTPVGVVVIGVVVVAVRLLLAVVP